jgi:hypothetical protein
MQNLYAKIYIQKNGISHKERSTWEWIIIERSFFDGKAAKNRQ